MNIKFNKYLTTHLSKGSESKYIVDYKNKLEIILCLIKQHSNRFKIIHFKNISHILLHLEFELTYCMYYLFENFNNLSIKIILEKKIEDNKF